MTANISKALLGITHGTKLRFHGRHTGLQGPEMEVEPNGQLKLFHQRIHTGKDNEVGLGCVSVGRTR